MKLLYVIRTVLILSILSTAIAAKAQQNDDLINILLKKNIISQQEADSLRADQAKKEQAQQESENQHGISIGSKALQISGLIQTEYEGYQKTAAGAYNSFSIHRARLDVKGNVSNDWSYEVYTEFAVSPKLLDAYTTYRIADFLKFTAGQFKVPFSLESLTDDSKLEFIDRTQVDNALAGRQTDVIGNQNGRDIGIKINGDFVKLDGHYLFDYTFGVFNGAGYDVSADNNNHKDIAGRFGVHPINNLVISADFYNGLDYFGTPAKNQTRDRRGIDGRYVIGGLAIQAEYDKGTDGTINRNGWYGQATYFVLPKKLQLAGRYETYDPNVVTANVTSNYYTEGVNYFFNDWAKFTVDYVERPHIKNNTIEAQLQLTF